MNALERISKNRTFLMGVAILWVLPVHLAFDIPTTYAWLPLNFIKTIGYGGVDIFLFLSGFGLYCSLKKDCQTLPFYKRRLDRILPSYWPAIAIWLLLYLICSTISLLEAAGNVFAFGWWLNLAKQLNWYTQAIFLFYLLAPLFFRAMEQTAYPRRTGGLLFALCFLSGLCLLASGPIARAMEGIGWLKPIQELILARHHLIALSRLPVFLLGMYFGKAF